MENQTSLKLLDQYPSSKFNILIPIQTISQIPAIQTPIIKAVQISINPEAKEIYEQEAASNGYTKNGRTYPPSPAKYALTKIGLTKLAETAGIRQVGSEPVLPSTCQKCATINRANNRFISCGQCGNKDVKYKVTVSVPQMTGETLYFVDHHEINIENATASMSDKQKAEFMKHLTQICEAKALNGAIRTALQIKGTYTLEELKKPFVVGYLAPNLDNPDVKRVAIESMFNSTKCLFGTNQSLDEPKLIEAPQDRIDENYADVIDSEEPEEKNWYDCEPSRTDRKKDFQCDKCGCVITEAEWDYSNNKFGTPLCRKHQYERRNQGA